MYGQKTGQPDERLDLDLDKMGATLLYEPSPHPHMNWRFSDPISFAADFNRLQDYETFSIQIKDIQAAKEYLGDFDYFDPDAALENPFSGDGDTLVFTGAMDYWANVDAVTWFAKEVFPGIKAKKPAAEFWIVGARPAAQVTALGSLPGVQSYSTNMSL